MDTVFVADPFWVQHLDLLMYHNIKLDEDNLVLKSKYVYVPTTRPQYSTK